jgi:hypothetical protein
MEIVIIFYGFIIGGFFVIAGAPWLRLFKKAGIPAWRMLVPGLNAYSMISLSGRRSPWLSVVALVGLPLYWLINGLAGLPADSILTPETILIPTAVFIASFYLFGFPLLSAAVLFSVCYLASTTPPAPGLMTALAAAAVCVAIAQAGLDFLTWRSLLKKLSRPLWQLVFVFLPFTALLAFTLIVLLARPEGSIGVLMGIVYATLLAGFGYLYYLGLSAKVLYARD